MSARWLCIGAGLALLAGCAAHPHANLATSIDQAERRKEVAVPAELRTGRRLPPIAVYFPPAAATVTALATEEKEEEEEDALFVDPRALEEEVVASLLATGVFENVIPVAPAGAAAAGLHAATEEARAKGASFLVEATLERPALRRTERSFVLPTLVWLTGIPTHWFHSHTYRLEVGLRLRLRDLNTGEALPERPLEPGRADEELSFIERTSRVWMYAVAFIVPSPFCPADADAVARALAAPALRRPVGQFLEHAAEALKGEVYTFEVQRRDAGAPVELRYPPAGKPLYLLKRKLRLSAVAAAAPGALVREVRVGGRVVFPARSAPGDVRRRRVPLEGIEAVAPGEALLLQVKDSAGRESSCLIVAKKEAR